MPYDDISELPNPVRHSLPRHAQEIYLSAFNNAWQTYRTRPDREAVAHKVAWTAVKKSYTKNEGDWVRRT